MMTEWVLILTLASYANNGGKAVEHIPGFISEAECINAGNRWLKQMNDADLNQARAICISRSKGER